MEQTGRKAVAELAAVMVNTTEQPQPIRHRGTGVLSIGIVYPPSLMDSPPRVE